MVWKKYRLNNPEKRQLPTIDETMCYTVIDDYEAVFERACMNNAPAWSRVECTIPTGDLSLWKYK